MESMCLQKCYWLLVFSLPPQKLQAGTNQLSSVDGSFYSCRQIWGVRENWVEFERNGRGLRDVGSV